MFALVELGGLQPLLQFLLLIHPLTLTGEVKKHDLLSLLGGCVDLSFLLSNDLVKVNLELLVIQLVAHCAQLAYPRWTRLGSIQPSSNLACAPKESLPDVDRGVLLGGFDSLVGFSQKQIRLVPVSVLRCH